jgi:hypothetical protein
MPSSDKTYDIFSGTPGKDGVWTAAVRGLSNAIAKMHGLAAERPGRYFVFCMTTRTVVSEIDTLGAPHTKPAQALAFEVRHNVPAQAKRHGKKKASANAGQSLTRGSGTDRRATPRYEGSLIVTVWPRSEPKIPAQLPAKDISLQGFYVISEMPIVLPRSFDFSFNIPHQIARKPILATGVARIVRREQLFIEGQPCFGLAARIERIQNLCEA